MTEKKQGLSGVLNLRVDEALAAEINRIAELQGITASEAARNLIRSGVEVERQVQASLLRVPYDWDTKKMPGRVVIEAAWKPYTRAEIWNMEGEPDESDWIPVVKVQGSEDR